MSDPLSILLHDFARHTGCDFVPPADGQAWLLCADKFDVRMSYDRHREVLMMQSVAGSLVPADEAADSFAKSGTPASAWATIRSAGDGDTRDALLWNRESGALVVLSHVPGRTLDSVAFTSWVERFTDRLVLLNGLLTQGLVSQSAESPER